MNRDNKGERRKDVGVIAAKEVGKKIQDDEEKGKN